MCFLFTARSLHAQIIDTVCVGYSNVPYAVDHHNGSTYRWIVEGGDIVSGNGSSRITVNWKKQPGIFRLSVVEQNELNCPGDSVFAYVLVKGNNFRVSYPPQACLNDSVTVKASGGIWYDWGNGFTDSSVSFRIIHDTALTVLISDTACGLRTDTFSMKIKAITKPTAAFSSGVEEYYKNQSVFFSYSGSTNDNVTWNIDKTIRPRLTAHAINVTFIDTGDAYIKLYSVNLLGCKDSVTRIVNIRNEQLFFPTAFTPNGDGLNDTFKPGGIGMKTYHLTIYNRWGQKIFETDNIEEGWDGTYKGETVDTETYIYTCDARGRSGKLYTYNGNITLLR